MAASTESWADATLHTYYLYFIAGISSIPAGVAYAYLAAHNLETWWSVLLVLTLGVALAHLGWTLAARQLKIASMVVSGASNIISTVPEHQHGSENVEIAISAQGHWIFGALAVVSWVIVGLTIWWHLPVPPALH